MEQILADHTQLVEEYTSDVEAGHANAKRCRSNAGVTEANTSASYMQGVLDKAVAVVADATTRRAKLQVELMSAVVMADNCALAVQSLLMIEI